MGDRTKTIYAFLEGGPLHGQRQIVRTALPGEIQLFSLDGPGQDVPHVYRITGETRRLACDTGQLVRHVVAEYVRSEAPGAAHVITAPAHTYAPLHDQPRWLRPPVNWTHEAECAGSPASDSLGQSSPELRQRLQALRRRCLLSVAELIPTNQQHSRRWWISRLELIKGRAWQIEHGEGPTMTAAIQDVVTKGEAKGWADDAPTGG